MIKFYAFLLVFSVAFCQMKIHPERLQKLFSEPMPDWMREQIQEDLAHFTPEDVTPQAIYANLQAVPSLIRMTIKNNECKWSTKKRIVKRPRLVTVLWLLEDAAQYLNFPDVDFLATLEDCYDYPDALERTRCPIFTMCKTEGNQKAVLWPELRGFDTKRQYIRLARNAEGSYPWSQKKEIAFWRGGSTGYWHEGWDWDFTPRAQIVLYSQRNPELVDAKFPSLSWVHQHTQAEFKNQDMGGYLAPKYQQKYKYLLAVDGNTFPSSLVWQLSINSAVIKNRSPYLEWYYRGIQDGVHYISYDTDCHDLKDVIEYLRANDDHAKQMAQAGMEFANKYLTHEGYAYYIYHLLHAYAKLQKGNDT